MKRSGIPAGKFLLENSCWKIPAGKFRNAVRTSIHITILKSFELDFKIVMKTENGQQKTGNLRLC